MKKAVDIKDMYDSLGAALHALTWPEEKRSEKAVARIREILGKKHLQIAAGYENVEGEDA